MDRRIFIALALIVSGCATTPDPTRRDLATAEQLASKQNVTEGLKPYYERIYWEGESQAALNRMRLASAAMEQNQWKDAEAALDEVISAIEALGPADPRSREALSHFQSEDIKKFKGEPYERAMAYFLRGLLYLRVSDWSNARACFKSVQLQNPSSSDHWISADWLEGWCDFQLNESSAAKECWEHARQHSGNSISLPSEKDSAICVALLGFGPIKIPKGKYGELLSYRPGESKTTHIQIRDGNSSRNIPILENLYAQASSLGKRQMDLVNEDKASTRAGTQTAGEVLTAAGIGTTIGGAVAGDTTVAAAGLGAAAAGLATEGIASSIQPKADVRTWDLLPSTIHAIAFSIPAKNTSLTFDFLNQNKTIIKTRTIDLSQNPNSKLILLIER